MFEYLKNLKRIYSSYTPDKNHASYKTIQTRFSNSLDENLELFTSFFEESADLTIKKFKLNGLCGAIITLEGMINKEVLSTCVTNPILEHDYDTLSLSEYYTEISEKVLSSSEQIEVSFFEDSFNYLASGFVLLLLDGTNTLIAIGAQGYSSRSVSEPTNEVMQSGSREGFVEAIKVNMSLIRRRMKTPKLKFESMKIGLETPTSICLCYLRDKVSHTMLDNVKSRLAEIDLPTVFASGYVLPYLSEKKDFSLFSGCYISERPDTICAKMAEGRIAIIIDGTPSVISVPYLFVEYFQNMDDYVSRPYFATFIRWLKYFSFFIATMLPGFYVAAGTFNPEIFPEELLSKIAISISTTPFPLMLEALIIHFIYEIVREAGLRLPKTLGHAVSIVGGLVIGDAAINSGLIGDTTLMILALTAVASYIIPSLYEPIAILRLLFILAGGFAGIWGIMLLFDIVVLSLCSKKSFGVPFMSPLIPFSLLGMRDVLVRASWKILSKKNNTVSDMPGISSDNE